MGNAEKMQVHNSEAKVKGIIMNGMILVVVSGVDGQGAEVSV